MKCDRTGGRSRRIGNTGGGIGKRQTKRSGMDEIRTRDQKHDHVADHEEEVAQGREGRQDGAIGHKGASVSV